MSYPAVLSTMQLLEDAAPVNDRKCDCCNEFKLRRLEYDNGAIVFLCTHCDVDRAERR